MRGWLALLLGVALAVTGIYAYRQHGQNQKLALELEAERQRSFSELVDHVESIQNHLGKGLAAGGSHMNIVSMSQVWRHSNQAIGNFTRLPMEQPVLRQTSKFLTQVGDFAYALLRQESRGTPASDEQWGQLKGLHDTSVTLAGQLNDAYSVALQDGFRFTGGQEAGFLARNLPEIASLGPVTGALDRAQEDLEAVPTLIYDGPFSDHLEKRQPKGLSGQKVSIEQARQKAIQFLGSDPGLSAGEPIEADTLPTYGFRSDHLVIDVTQQGGAIVQFVKNRDLGEQKLDLKAAKEKAAAFLANRGYTDMQPSYAMQEDGTAVVNFSAKQGNILMYPDLIKVRVALDNGEVTGMEAQGYLMSHHQRDLPPAKVTVADATARVNHRLKAEYIGEVVIPLDNGREAHCYEFRGKLGDQTMLVYVNTQTGFEEKILQVLTTDKGTFTL